MSDRAASPDDNLIAFPGASSEDVSDVEAEIRTFLIADVRGYTSFTQERGDEAAGRLAATFAAIVRETVEAGSGRLLELRGDEALSVFASTRQAIRTAVALQERFVEHTLEEPDYPLRVGIGIDAGEAVPVEGGYRGGALNLAARLCGQAGPGQVLASRESTHLARRIDGLSYLEHGEIALKGLPEPVRVVRVVPEAGDPAARLPRAQGAEAVAGGRKRWLVAAAVGSAVVVAAAVAAFTLLGGESGLPSSAQEIPENGVGLLSADSGRVSTVVDVGDAPGGIAFANGAAWVTQPSKGTVTRISADSGGIVATVPVGLAPTGVAAGPGGVWVANSGSGTVSRVNPESNTVVQTVRVGNGPVAVAANERGVWVVAALDSKLVRLDPASGHVVARIGVGREPTAVAVGGGSVWVANGGAATVSRVSITGNRVVETIGVGRGPSSLAAYRGAAWVTNSLDDTASRIDVGTGVVTSTTVGAEPSAIVASEEAVWVANSGDSTLGKLDPRNGDELGSVMLTSSPAALALDGAVLATGTKALASAHRGGELRVVSADSVTQVDPALWTGNPVDALGLTHDALLAPRHVGGAAGLGLVPSLATSLPVPTDGGRTYTFVLRRGIRFSDGSPLRASDVAHSVRRALALSEWAAGVLHLDGLGRCVRGSARCDLGRAVDADDVAGTVTFHLAEPDPDFFYKISGPWFWVVPRTTPLRPVRSANLPGTGPYRLAEVSLAPPERQGRSRVVLERNPHFVVWSAAARPDGFADRVVVRGGLSAERAFGSVARNDADVVYYTQPPPAMVDELETTYTARRHVLSTTHQFYYFLNTRVPPFDKVDVRRAVAFALDREHAAKGLDHRSVVSCQMLTSSLPGHVPSCPYTRDPSTEGAWDAPDLAKAQALVERSGTAGDPVTIATSGSERQWVEALAETLRDLGYEVKIRVVPGDPYSGYYTEISDPKSRVQAGPIGWAPDIPTANGVFEPLVSCGGFANPAHFCDRDLDSLIERAKRVQGRDPAAANELWAEVDRRVIDASPLVPYATRAFVDLVSDRVGNYQYNPLIGPLLGQMWVE